MAGDEPAGMPYKHMKGFTLPLNYNTADQAPAIFKALAEDGTVVMPMQPDFSAKTSGVVNDRFGTLWIVNRQIHDYL